MDDNDLDEMSRFDQSYSAKQGFLPGLKSLTDGRLDGEILHAEMGRTEQTRDLILRFTIRCIGGVNEGAVFEHVTFFNRQESINRLGGDLVTLGFDADRWTAANGRPFSGELLKALPRLKGKRFRGRKETNGQYHNLHIDAAMSAGSKPTPAPTSVPAGQPAAVNRVQTPAPVQTATNTTPTEPSEGDIPF